MIYYCGCRIETLHKICAWETNVCLRDHTIHCTKCAWETTLHSVLRPDCTTAKCAWDYTVQLYKVCSRETTLKSCVPDARVCDVKSQQADILKVVLCSHSLISSKRSQIWRAGIWLPLLLYDCLVSSIKLISLCWYGFHHIQEHNMVAGRQSNNNFLKWQQHGKVFLKTSTCSNISCSKCLKL